MDRKDALIIASRYAHAVRDRYDFQKVILFGSYAKGTFNEDSDIDIAVIFHDFNNLVDIQVDLMRIRRNIDSRIEPHPFRATEFNASNPVASEIMKFGQEIHLT
ncbi:MAG: nucleotidyltransferase domain-containing protein [Bacteroidales bacterium]